MVVSRQMSSGGAAYLDVPILAAVDFSPHILGLNISSFRWPSLDHHIITCRPDGNKLLAVSLSLNVCPSWSKTWFSFSISDLLL